MTHNMSSSNTSSSNSPPGFTKGTWYCVEIPSIVDEIGDVEESVIEALAQTSFSDVELFAVRLALDEALANAIRHGNGADPCKKVFVRFCMEDARITISVRDEGRGFDVTNIPDPTEDERLELPCGRGLLLMKSYMDSVTFNECGNEVTMVKTTGGSPCVR